MRKGALSISTNAIVILIVAVIMLGLIIGLVTRGFGLVEDRFIDQIKANEPDPETPTISTPLTLSADTKAAERGQPLVLKIGVLNPGTSVGGPTDVIVAPTINCRTGVLAPVSDGKIQVNSAELSVNERRTYIYVNEVLDTAPAGQHLCQITMQEYAQVTDETPSASCTDDACTRFSSTEFIINIKG